MNFDVSVLPFSKYGSYLSVTLEQDKRTFKLRNCRRLFGEEELADFVFQDENGQVVDIEVKAYPSKIEVISSKGNAFIILRGDEEMLISSHGLKAHVTIKGVWGFKVSESVYRCHKITNHNYSTNLAVINGTIIPNIVTEVVDNYHKQVKTEFTLDADFNGKLAFGIHVSSFEINYNPVLQDIDEEVSKVNNEWENFRNTMPAVNVKYAGTAEALWYNLWSSVIRAGGNMKYDSMLMSKSYMCAVWSWDHCFNALALLASGNTKGALEQFFVPFEMQSVEGKLPDLINTEIDWRACVKPPIHGWCFNIIMDNAEISDEMLKKAYTHLQKWTDWHFSYRDPDGDGIPDYIMGNDSGWDNSTVFDIGTNIESPDLSAYLFLQMKVLKRIALKLNWLESSQMWDEKANELFNKLLKHSWSNDGFLAKQSGTHNFQESPTSLLTLMPIVMGEYLPKDIISKIVDQIQKNHVTDFGISTESVYSDKYTSNGYWRGPIWAPTTYLVVDGLRRGGYVELAKTIAERFCNTVAKSGSYENYDALTGKGLCDRGYTWTSSAALCLMNQYC